MGHSCTTTLIVLATVLGPVTVVFMAVSFGTDHWLECDVARSQLSSTLRNQATNTPFSRFSHDRERGMFRECYTGNDTEFLDSADPDEDGNCFDIEYTENDDRETPSDEYDLWLNLNRCHLGFFITSMVFFIISYVFGIVLCCLKGPKWAYIAGLLAFTSGFMLAVCIACFHGAEYVQENDMEKWEWYGTSEPTDPSESDYETVWDLTDCDYAYSYAMAWVAMICCCVVATLYSLAGCYLSSEKFEKHHHSEKHKYQDNPAMHVYGGYPAYPLEYTPQQAITYVDQPYVSQGSFHQHPGSFHNASFHG